MSLRHRYTPHALLFENIHPRAKDIFEAAGYDVETVDHAVTGDDILKYLNKYIKNPTVVGIRSKTHLDGDFFEKAPSSLSAIGCFCIGTNQVDINAASQIGVPVFNAPYGNTRSVAELVIAEAILLMRRIPEKDRAVHRGGWLKTARGSYEVRGKTLGIVGYGHIGSQVSILAESLGLRVIFYDIDNKLPLGNAESVDNLESLYTQSDIVTFHVPATPETENMLDKGAISQLKEGACVINASRGSVVDLSALAKAVEAGHIRGAAIDVYPEEPSSIDDPFVSPLQGLDNVILTPHIGGSTQEAQENIASDAAHKLISFGHGSTRGAVNLPNIDPGPLGERVLRFVHIHDNQSGTLSAINVIISEYKGNIINQSLRTLDTIGLAVTDVEGLSTWRFSKFTEKLADIDGTIRTITIDGNNDR